MPENKNQDLPGIEPHSLPQDWVAQLRQISVPLWARALVLIISLSVLLPGVLLIWIGWLGCTEFVTKWLNVQLFCHEKWIEQGLEIVVPTLVPVLVILYLVFAETGMRSLTRRTNELLEKIIPNALGSAEGDAARFSYGIKTCKVSIVHHYYGSVSVHYLLYYEFENARGELRLSVDVNVTKAVVVFFIPAKMKSEKIRELLAPTIIGAEHEGYVFDEKNVEKDREGRRYLLLIARRNLPADFLWNPAAKMHFSWDLRAFTYSVIHDVHTLLES